MERKISKISAKPVMRPALPAPVEKRRVAVYARVSTSNEEQLLSIEAQKDYYPRYIAFHPNWEFVGLYADEGISGTSSKNRTEFNHMIKDALAGKFDLIITKSISRFARNTIDTLTTIRDLKDAGIEVYFEREQIFTFDSSGEFLLTLLSSIAQEESRSLSENVTWAKRKLMADGHYSMPYKHFLGYKKGRDGRPEVVEEEAKIVKLIYRLYLQGKTPSMIAKYLMDDKIPSPGGTKTWQTSTVRSILKNEKYYGAALLQKTYTHDYLSKKQRKNKGELPQYYIEEAHEPIISKEVFDEVQIRLAKPGYDNPSIHTFSNKIICGDCRCKYGRKTIGSYKANKKYRYVVWECSRKCDHAYLCKKTPQLREGVMECAFNQAVLHLWAGAPKLHCLCEKLVISTIRASKKHGSKAERANKIENFLAEFCDRSPTDIAFDESTWFVMIDCVVVTREGVLRLCFVDDIEVLLCMS